MADTELTLHYGQDVLLQDRTHRDHAIVAGVGYGKTRAGPPWLEQRRAWNPRSREFLIIAPTYKLLRKRCFEDYRDFLHLIGYDEGRSGDYSFNKSDPSFEFANGQKIIGVSGDNPEAIVSYTTAAIWIDEAALCVEQVRKNALKRNRCPRADVRPRQILYTTTPEGLNWVYEVFHPDKLKPTGTGVHEESRTALLLRGASHDNPYLDDDYLKMLEEEFGWDASYYASYILGQWVSLSKDRFYFAFDENVHVGNYPPDPANPYLYLTWDNNVGQMTFACIQPEGNTYRVVYDNGGRGRNIEDTCEQFVTAFPPSLWGAHRITVLGDATLWQRSIHSYSTGYATIEHLLRKHYPRLTVEAHRGNPFVEERSRCTNKLYATSKLFVDRSAKKVIHSAKVAESDGKGGIRKPKNDTHTHAHEAVDMALIVLAPPLIERGYQGMK